MKIVAGLIQVFFLWFGFTVLWSQDLPGFRINQLGYLPDDPKTAFLIGDGDLEASTLPLYDKLTGKVALEVRAERIQEGYYGLEPVYKLDFSELQVPGAYYFSWKEVSSPDIFIDGDVYRNTADYLLQYMRSRRCGYNPFSGSPVTRMMASSFTTRKGREKR